MIELTTVIKELRSELERAVLDPEDKMLHFELGTIEMEITVAFEQTEKLGGKVRFWVLDLGADEGKGTTSTQRIKLTLQPTLVPDGEQGKPYVSGRAAENEE